MRKLRLLPVSHSLDHCESIGDIPDISSTGQGQPASPPRKASARRRSIRAPLELGSIDARPPGLRPRERSHFQTVARPLGDQPSLEIRGIEPKTWNTSSPAADEVSIFSSSDMNPRPRFLNSSTVSKSCRKLAPTDRDAPHTRDRPGALIDQRVQSWPVECSAARAILEQP